MLTTLFEAASLSKPIFTHFVEKLVEIGTIDLDTSRRERSIGID